VEVHSAIPTQIKNIKNRFMILGERTCTKPFLQIHRRWGHWAGHGLGDDWTLGPQADAFFAVRPEQDAVLTTMFAIDAEADLLDWMDEQHVDETMNMKTILTDLSDGCEGLLHLMKWASPGQWEVWEGRAFLYLESAIGREAEDIHELYSSSVWDDTVSRLGGVSDDEFAERVVLDWMDRRKALGETLDETKDPKIVPTFEAHTRAAKALVHTVNRARVDEDLQLVVGREHLAAAKWGHDAWNLFTFLQS
jgi:hypothetical protein